MMYNGNLFSYRLTNPDDTDLLAATFTNKDLYPGTTSTSADGLTIMSEDYISQIKNSLLRPDAIPVTGITSRISDGTKLCVCNYTYLKIALHNFEYLDMTPENIGNYLLWPNEFAVFPDQRGQKLRWELNFFLGNFYRWHLPKDIGINVIGRINYAPQGMHDVTMSSATVEQHASMGHIDDDLSYLPSTENFKTLFREEAGPNGLFPANSKIQIETAPMVLDWHNDVGINEDGKYYYIPDPTVSLYNMIVAVSSKSPGTLSHLQQKFV